MDVDALRQAIENASFASAGLDAASGILPVPDVVPPRRETDALAQQSPSLLAPVPYGAVHPAPLDAVSAIDVLARVPRPRPGQGSAVLARVDPQSGPDPAACERMRLRWSCVRRSAGMRVVASRRTVVPGDSDDDCDLLVPYTDLATLLGESDYVVLCVPLTKETVRLIGAPELRQMKPSAALINIARGQVVDQDALVEALRDGTIAAAALDVTDPEPLPPESPLWDMPNVILTPHVSGAVEGYGHRAVEIFARNLRHYVRGEPLENVVDPVLAY